MKLLAILLMVASLAACDRRTMSLDDCLDYASNRPSTGGATIAQRQCDKYEGERQAVKNAEAKRAADAKERADQAAREEWDAAVATFLGRPENASFYSDPERMKLLNDHVQALSSLPQFAKLSHADLLREMDTRVRQQLSK